MRGNRLGKKVRVEQVVGAKPHEEWAPRRIPQELEVGEAANVRGVPMQVEAWIAITEFPRDDLASIAGCIVRHEHREIGPALPLEGLQGLFQVACFIEDRYADDEEIVLDENRR